MKRKITLFIAAAALSGSCASSPPSSATPARRHLHRRQRQPSSSSGRRRSARFSSTHAAERSTCSRRTSAAGVRATAPARRTRPPLVSPAKPPREATGVRAALLGVGRRTDGKRQVAYAGHPLYTFSLNEAGETTGQGRTDFGAYLECRLGYRSRGHRRPFLRQCRRRLRRRLRRLQPRPLSVDPGRGILAPPRFNRPSVNPHANRRPGHPPSRFGGNQPREGRSTDPMTPRQIIRRVRAFPALAAATAVLVGSIAATASGDPTAPTHKRVTPPVNVTVFSPREGDVAGRESRGFFVDLALRYPSVASSGASFQLTGPGTHQNQAPFPGAAAPGVDEKLPGLIVLLSTSTVGARNAQNLANLFNLTGFTNQKTNEIWDTWLVGASVFGQERPLGATSRRRRRQEQGRRLQRRTSGRPRREPRRPYQRRRPHGLRGRFQHRGRPLRDPRLNELAWRWGLRSGPHRNSHHLSYGHAKTPTTHLPNRRLRRGVAGGGGDPMKVKVWGARLGSHPRAPRRTATGATPPASGSRSPMGGSSCSTPARASATSGSGSPGDHGPSTSC